MSATFKLAAKKKYTQNDLRRLMNEQKAKIKQEQAGQQEKIDSPLAKYNDAGQLTCVLCKSVVRSEAVWKVHINTKLHKENIVAAKQLKERLEMSKKSKRYGEELLGSETVPEKRAREQTPSTSVKQEPPEMKPGVPSDFFDSNSHTSYFEATLGKTSIKKELVNIKRERRKSINDPDNRNGETNSKMEVEAGKDDPLPEGFFDDPVKDAKIRNQEYKDPQEEEWERFQREIKAQSTVSNAIIAEEREEATTERQIEEIDEQIRKWSRVLDLEKKKEAVVTKIKQRPIKMDTDQNDTDSEEEIENDFDEFLDWRAKKSHR